MGIAESLGLNIWRDSGRFVLLDKKLEVVASFPSSQELCHGVLFGKSLITWN